MPAAFEDGSHFTLPPLSTKSGDLFTLRVALARLRSSGCEPGPALTTPSDDFGHSVVLTAPPIISPTRGADVACTLVTRPETFQTAKQ